MGFLGGSVLSGILRKIKASDIDAETSTNGQVLTSDGAGNVTWETASGGGGCLFDGATLTVISNAESWAHIHVQATLNGVNCAERVFATMYLSEHDQFLNLVSDVVSFGVGFGAGYLWQESRVADPPSQAMTMISDAQGLFEFGVVSDSAGIEFKVIVVLPTGGYVISETITSTVVSPP